MAGAETAHFLGGGGAILEMSLPLPEVMQDQVTKGYLRRCNADGSPYIETAEHGGQPELKRPAKSDNKPEWVGWAVRAFGVKPDDADAMTKTDLVEKYDRDPDPAPPAE